METPENAMKPPAERDDGGRPGIKMNQTQSISRKIKKEIMHSPGEISGSSGQRGGDKSGSKKWVGGGSGSSVDTDKGCPDTKGRGRRKLRKSDMQEDAETCRRMCSSAEGCGNRRQMLE